MDPVEEMYPALRPQRQHRLPSKLRDYEVGNVGYQPRGLPTFSLPPSSPALSQSFTGDAAHPEMPQLAPSRFQRTSREWGIQTSPTPAFTPHPSPYQDLNFPLNIRGIQKENTKLFQSQQWIQSELKELNEARTEIRELIEVFRSLKVEMAHSNPVNPTFSTSAAAPSYHVPNVESQEESEWPDPPPWPELEEDLECNFQHLRIQRDSNQHYDPVWPPAPPPHLLLAAPDLTQWCPPVVRAPLPSQPPTHSVSSPVSEQFYRGPHPTIPKFINPDPTEFARLRIALENLLPVNTTELFKYQVLVDHLMLEEARLIADAYLNSRTPYTDTMAALHDKFGQPHQLALRKIASVLEAPEVKRGDIAAFQKFSLQIQSLVGLLQTLGPEGEVELKCGSHVARLLSKLPAEQRADFRRNQFKQSGATHTLLDLSEWLHYESWCQGFDSQATVKTVNDRQHSKSATHVGKQSVSIFHTTGESVPPSKASSGNIKNRTYCAFCESDEHHLSQCSEVTKLSREQLKDWIQVNKRCWRCARDHFAAHCTLKKMCSLCNRKHLQVLHDINTKPIRVSQVDVQEKSSLADSASTTLYLDKSGTNHRALLKVVPILIHYSGQTISAFAILDDGSERSMLLPAAARALGVKGTPEDLPLRTVRQDTQVLKGYSVSFHISPVSKPHTSYKINGAFTSNRLSLGPHTYPVEQLQDKFRHLRELPIPAFKNAEPSLLIGSDQPHLITPVEPVRLGPPGSPAAVHTRLGWTLQGPVQLTGRPTNSVQCLFTSAPPQLQKTPKPVEMPWQTASVPCQLEERTLLSKDQQVAVNLKPVPTPTKESAPQIDMPLLHSIETSLLKNAEKVETLQQGKQEPRESIVVPEVKQEHTILKNIQRDMVPQYNSPGCPSPSSTKAKLITCPLSDKQLGWGNSNLTPELWQPWASCEKEFQFLFLLSLPYRSVFAGADLERATRLVDACTETSKPVPRAVPTPRPDDPRPGTPNPLLPDGTAVLRKTTFCTPSVPFPDGPSDTAFSNWRETQVRELHGQDLFCASPSAEECKQAVTVIKLLTRHESFPEDVQQLSTEKPVSYTSHLLTLSSKPKQTMGLIRAGDQWISFRGGGRELQEDFADTSPSLQQQLAHQRITFCFYPPVTHTSVEAQIVPEDILCTMFLPAFYFNTPQLLDGAASQTSDRDPDQCHHNLEMDICLHFYWTLKFSYSPFLEQMCLAHLGAAVIKVQPNYLALTSHSSRDSSYHSNIAS